MSVFALRRGGVYPPNCVYEGAYGFGPLGPGELDGYMADARALANILGLPGVDDDVATGRATRWFINDAVSSEFGFELPPDAVANPAVFIRRGDVALAEVNGRRTTACGITPPDTWATYLVRAADGKTRDVHLLGDVRDRDGARHLPFKEVLLRSKEAVLIGFPLKRAVRRPRAAAGHPRRRPERLRTTWLRKSDVSEKSASAREYRCI